MMLTDLHLKLDAIRSGEFEEATVYRQSSSPRRHMTPAAGPVFHCPLCGTWHRKFLPFGLGRRRNAMCPSCGSLERHRYLWRHLMETHRVSRRRLSILHVAPEPAIGERLSALPNIEYLSIDRFAEGAQRNMDLTDLSLPDERFDMVICSHVLEHIGRDDLAIAEMARILRPGGHIVVMVPVDRNLARTYEDPTITDPVDRHKAFGHPYHVRVCGMDYPERMKAAGFDVKIHDAKRLRPIVRRVERINKPLLFEGRIRSASR